MCLHKNWHDRVYVFIGQFQIRNVRSLDGAGAPNLHTFISNDSTKSLTVVPDVYPQIKGIAVDGL